VRIASAASWVALGVAAVLGYAGWREISSLREELASARAERAGARAVLAEAQTRAEAAERERAELGELLTAVAAREARMLALSSGTHAGARAFVTSERVVLLVHDLARAAPGRTYQLWAIEGGVPRSAGVFDTDASGRARYRASLGAAIRDDAVLAVTLEPAGGVPQPTGPIVLAQR
jgi:anti-sigma-K factor RskA